MGPKYSRQYFGYRRLGVNPLKIPDTLKITHSPIMILKIHVPIVGTAQYFIRAYYELYNYLFVEVAL